MTEKKKKEGHSELKEVLARMKQMDELYKRREKEHLDTIAAMQKRLGA